MKHLAVWTIHGKFSPCDLATANNLNAKTLCKVANATYRFVKGQRLCNYTVWFELVMLFLLINMNRKDIEILRAQNLILAKEIDKLKTNTNAEETEM